MHYSNWLVALKSKPNLLVFYHLVLSVGKVLDLALSTNLMQNIAPQAASFIIFTKLLKSRFWECRHYSGCSLFDRKYSLNTSFIAESFVKSDFIICTST